MKESYHMQNVVVAWQAFIPILLVAVYAHLSRHLVFLENTMLKIISGCRFSEVLLHFHSCRQILLHFHPCK